MKRMKWMTVMMMCLMGIFVLASCSDDDDNDGDVRQSDVPEAVLAAFSGQYAGIGNVEWEREYDGSYVADFWKDSREHEASYSADGTWIQTEIDYGRDFAALPPAVQEGYNATEYASQWAIDDIDEIQRPDVATQYKIEVEKAGQRDMHLYFSPDGVLTNAVAEAD